MGRFLLHREDKERGNVGRWVSSASDSLNLGCLGVTPRDPAQWQWEYCRPTLPLPGSAPAAGGSLKDTRVSAHAHTLSPFLYSHVLLLLRDLTEFRNSLISNVEITPRSTSSVQISLLRSRPLNPAAPIIRFSGTCATHITKM